MRSTPYASTLLSTPARAQPPFWSADVLRFRNAPPGGAGALPHKPQPARVATPPVAVDVSQRFGQRLRSLRAARKMTQQDMARRFGIDRSFISDVERGRKSISLVTLEILAIGLGVSISELLNEV